MLDLPHIRKLPKLIPFLFMALDQFNFSVATCHVQAQIIVADFSVFSEAENLVAALAVALETADDLVFFVAQRV